MILTVTENTVSFTEHYSCRLFNIKQDPVIIRRTFSLYSNLIIIVLNEIIVLWIYIQLIEFVLYFCYFYTYGEHSIQF